MRSFTPFEIDRREAVEAGYSTVARLHRGVDDTLIQWAQSTGRYVYIGMATWQGKLQHPQSPWGNPYHNPKYGSLQRRLDLYARHLDTRPDLRARLPELRGMVLCCWCAPALCHGEVLLKRLQDGSFERYQAAVEEHRETSTAVCTMHDHQTKQGVYHDAGCLTAAASLRRRRRA